MPGCYEDTGKKKKNQADGMWLSGHLATDMASAFMDFAFCKQDNNKDTNKNTQELHIVTGAVNGLEM